MRVLHHGYNVHLLYPWHELMCFSKFSMYNCLKVVVLDQLAPYATDHLFPEWEIWTQFLAQSYAAALSVDGLSNSHPIEVYFIFVFSMTSLS